VEINLQLLLAGQLPLHFRKVQLLRPDLAVFQHLLGGSEIHFVDQRNGVRGGVEQAQVTAWNFIHVYHPQKIIH
jgi:hypothetical protein